jgi:hypothetical protein
MVLSIFVLGFFWCRRVNPLLFLSVVRSLWGILSLMLVGLPCFLSGDYDFWVRGCRSVGGLSNTLSINKDISMDNENLFDLLESNKRGIK